MFAVEETEMDGSERMVDGGGEVGLGEFVDRHLGL